MANRADVGQQFVRLPSLEFVVCQACTASQYSEPALRAACQRDWAGGSVSPEAMGVHLYASRVGAI